jgi:hypothetical protein
VFIISYSSKVIIALVVVLGSAGMLFYVLSKIDHPEKLLIGKWKEVEWHYDKVDRGAQGSSFVQKGYIQNRLKEEITGELFIHQAEEWHFYPDGNLELLKMNNETEMLSWRLKGRGHILKLKHTENMLEFYQIRVLNKDEMILNFENDLHARGIIEIRFKRIKE